MSINLFEHQRDEKRFLAFSSWVNWKGIKFHVVLLFRLPALCFFSNTNEKANTMLSSGSWQVCAAVQKRAHTPFVCINTNKMHYSDPKYIIFMKINSAKLIYEQLVSLFCCCFSVVYLSQSFLLLCCGFCCSLCFPLPVRLWTTHKKRKEKRKKSNDSKKLRWRMRQRLWIRLAFCI